MARTTRTLLAVALATLGAACADSSTGTQDDALDIAVAFTTSPAGFGGTTSSFSASGDSAGYRPEGGGPGGHRHRHGPNGLPEGSDFMGGGFRDDFLGGPRGGGGRPFDETHDSGTCSFSAATGLVTCTGTTRHGLTVNRTIQYRTAAGAVQQALDSLTNTVTTHVQVSGTAVRRDSVTAVVSHVSDRTVTGLAKGSTQRTVNGTSAGTENLSGTSADKGAFTATRVIGDSITALVIPVQDGRPTYPTSGTVIRSMSVTVTYAGQAATTSTRREVVTYNGTSTATLVITRDGTTKTCTLPLPHGRPTCQ
jgi:hypothetical protein